MVQRGRLRERLAHARDHDHVDYLTSQAHDQLLHEQHVLPTDTRVYFDYDAGNSTGGNVWTTQFDPPDLDIPTWVAEVNIYCVAVCEMPAPSSNGLFEARVVIGGQSSTGVSYHRDGLVDDEAVQCVVAYGRQIVDPASTLDIHVDTRTAASSGDSLTVQLTTSVTFERFAGTQGGGGLAG